MYERHADLIDEANALAAALTKGAIDAARRATEPETHPDFDNETCVECGDPIPEERLAMGKIRCVRCQAAREHRSKLYAGPGLGSPIPAWSMNDPDD